MSLYANAFSLTRYFIEQDSIGFDLGRLNSCISNKKSAPLKLHGIHKEDVYAWQASPAAEIDAAEDWLVEDCLIESGFFLRMRHERRRVSAQVLTEVYRQKVSDVESQGRILSKKDKKGLKDSLKLELLGQAIPTISFTDAFWHDERKELWLATSSKKRRAAFEELFKETFTKPAGVKLVPCTAPALALEKDLRQSGDFVSGELSKLHNLMPTFFSESKSAKTVLKELH